MDRNGRRPCDARQPSGLPRPEALSDTFSEPPRKRERRREISTARPSWHLVPEPGAPREARELRGPALPRSRLRRRVHLARALLPWVLGRWRRLLTHLARGGEAESGAVRRRLALRSRCERFLGLRATPAGVRPRVQHARRRAHRR